MQYLYRLEDALACHDKALALNPDYAEAHCNRGSVLNSIKRPQDALASFNRAIAVNPDFAQAHFNKAITELGLGNMEDGWREFEWRRKIVEMAGNRIFPKPLLTSLDEVQGKTILVHFEHGFGDTIQFYRYLELLHRAGAKVLLNAQAKLERLLSSPGFPLTFVNLDDPTLAYDYHVPMMSLPLACGTIVETIPAKVPYISPEAELGPEMARSAGRRWFQDRYLLDRQPDPSQRTPEPDFSCHLFRAGVKTARCPPDQPAKG